MLYKFSIFMAEQLFKNMHLQLSSDDIRKIDEWKIAHGMKSRTEAIRAMIRVVIGDSDEGSAGGGFSEKERSSFMRPEPVLNRNAGNNDVETLVRKVVKEELQKILNSK